MSAAIVYLRVSTDEQAEHGYGLPAQEAACRRWCDANGYKAVGPFVDDEGVSGSTALHKRPALVEALGRLSPGSVLLVAKRDRIARDRGLIAGVEKQVSRKRSRLVSAAGEGTEGKVDDPTSSLHRGVVDLFSEHERNVIRSRTSDGLQLKRAIGERVGSIPYGAELDPDGPRNENGRLMKLRAVPAEVQIILEIGALSRRGMGPNAIAAYLNDVGAPTKNPGAQWHASTVRRILSRESPPCPSNAPSSSTSPAPLSPHSSEPSSTNGA